MINYIWLGFIVLGALSAVVTGNVQTISSASINWAKTSVELAIGLIGTISLWSGLMKIAEEAGLVKDLGRLLRPILVRQRR